LSVGVHSTDPARQREDTITGHGEYKSGSSKNANTGILREKVEKSAIASFFINQEKNETTMRPMTEMMVITTLPCLPRAKA
jgi:hypothetical protein